MNAMMLVRTMRAVLVFVLAGSIALSFPAFAADAFQVSGEAAPPAIKDVARLNLRLATYPESAVAQLSFPPIEPTNLQRMRERNSSDDSKVLQLGVDRIVADEANSKVLPTLYWMALGEGGQVARFAAVSPGAAALRIELKVSDLPDNAELRFVGNDQSRSVVDVVIGSEIKRLAPDQTYWTPATTGERQVVEIYLPIDAEAARVRFTVVSVSHLYATPYESLQGMKIGESDACEVDANCVSNPSSAYINAKNAVARMLFQKNGGSFLCTGTVLNDTATTTFIPYFYSANHCISTQAVASTLTTFWLEESTSCGSGVASARVQVSGGATLLYNNEATDVLLLRLNNAVPAGAYFSGWDSNTLSPGTDILVLHHPAGDVKKVSIGQATGFGTFNGAGNFIQAGYTTATTEGGSSGAGLLVFSGNEYRLRGGLFGGSASCANTGSISNPDNNDAFSRFDLAFPNLQPYLMPTGGASNALQNGVPVSGLNGAVGSSRLFTISIPTGAQNLVVRTSGGSGDPDLYVRFGLIPTTSSYDCRSFIIGVTEQCSFLSPLAGTYNVLIYGFAAYNGLSLVASWTESLPTLTVLEYYSARLNHYFISSAPAEQSFLDAGNVIDFSRTGLQFKAFAVGAPGTNAVCRFYSILVNSHFYTASSAECSLVINTMPIWNYERNEFGIALPAGTQCPAGMTPVYRNFNNRPNDYNHRFTTSLSTYNSMVAAGWMGEGIVMCSPL
jgi:hypothetical protein